MIRIILLAPPAAGKGVQAQLLKEHYHLSTFATGDLLRKEVKQASKLGLEIKEIMVRGGLVSDKIVLDLLNKELDVSKGVIFDGFPRTLTQAKALTNFLKAKGIAIDYVFFLKIDIETALKRGLGRLNCPHCGSLYNKYYDQFKVKDCCNQCGTKLEQRDDDNEITFRKRFTEYLDKTKPLLSYYEEQGLLYQIDGGQTINDVFLDIKRVIKEGYHD